MAQSLIIIIIRLLVLASGLNSATAQPKIVTVSYLGCYVDQGSPNRDLVGLVGLKTFGSYSTYNPNPEFVYQGSSPLMTIQLCASICAIGRFRYLGLQARSFCGCDSTYGSYGIAPDTDCYLKCDGNHSQYCGGDKRNSVYEITYIPYGASMTKVAAASLPSITAISSAITHWNQSARSSIQCAAACHRSPDCLGCAFVKSSQVCRLMRFAAIPSEIAAETAWIWMKN